MQAVNFSKILIFTGLTFIAVGLVVFILHKFNIPLGRLPGDIAIKRDSFSFYFPVTTCIIISIVLTVIFYIFRR